MSSRKPHQDQSPGSDSQDPELELEMRRAFESIAPPRDFPDQIRQHLRTNIPQVRSILSEDAEEGTISSNEPLETANAPTHAPEKVSAANGWLARRTSLIAASIVSVAAGLALALGFLFSDAAVSDQQLAAIAADGLSQSQDWGPPSPLPDTLLAFVIQNIKVEQSGVVGARKIAPSDLAPDGCQMWELSSPEGTIYVGFLPKLAGSSNLSQQLSLIQDSGNWSIAAAKQDSHVVFIASQGDVRRHFKPQRYA
ncbi:MAG: hypothetical protein ACE361_04970 [Aureliella sp.]